MFKKVFLSAFLLVLSTSAFSQFFDNEDEILFYIEETRNGEPVDFHKTQAFVVNFDGYKACGRKEDQTSMIRYLTKDINYWEKSFYNSEYKYREDKSSDIWTVYNYRWSGSHDYFIWVSKDRNTLVFCTESSMNPREESVYKRVDKKYFIDRNDKRSRSGFKSRVISE